MTMNPLSHHRVVLEGSIVILFHIASRFIAEGLQKRLTVPLHP
ncbi:Uncharacterised protein [Chlamydia trachomatis]|nr:Uncharacterised protein [Chlamydia trachomatis]